MGHLGETQGLNLLQQNYWCPGCSSAMKEAFRKCCECQVVTKQHNIKPMKPDMLPEGPFQKVAVDFKGPFYDGYYALVFVDLYSRLPEAYFLKSTSFNAVEKHFLRYFATYGTLLKIKSDKRPPFNGEEFSNFSKIHGFKHQKLTPKHPQANGDIENYMKQIQKTAAFAKVSKADYKAEVMRRMIAERATPQIVTGRSPYQTLLGRKMRIGCISPEDQQHRLRNNQEDNMRGFVDKKKKKSKDFYDVKHKANKQNFHLGEEILVKDKQDREYIPNTFQIINIKGSSIEAKKNSDGKVVFQDASHFKVYHRRNHPVVNVEIRNTESSSTAANQITSVSDVRNRPTQTTAGKA